MFLKKNDADLCWLMGVFVCIGDCSFVDDDDSFLRGESPYCVEFRFGLDHVDFAKDLFEKIFALKKRVCKEENYLEDFFCYIVPCYEHIYVICRDEQIYRIFEQVDDCGRVPRYVIESDIDCKKSYLAGLSCDNIRNGNGKLQICCTWLYDVYIGLKDLVESIGLDYEEDVEDVGKYRKSYCIYVDLGD